MNIAVAAPQEITSILNMPKGARIAYHVGFLAVDRGLTKRSTAQQEINETANIAWKLMGEGKIALCQRRIAPGFYEYIAERR